MDNAGIPLDTEAKQLTVDGEPVKLTAKEYKILELLMSNPGVVFSAEKIYEQVWKDIPLIYKFLCRIYDLVVSLFDGRAFSKYPLTRSLFYRQLIFIILSFVFVFFTFVFMLAESPAFIIPPVLEAIIIYWYIKGNNRTYMDINRGFNESLEEQMKSERMKVALITNVSHDLKTPLTSIVSYIDLLSKEDLPESTRDYVRILGEKAGRLSNMVSDLFDLAKSTSGNMPVDIEKLDLKKLVEQTLADMSDRIDKSRLSLRIKLPENPMHIFADGKKLSRVFRNIIDNALKYSLQGTRVYVALEETEGVAVATVKNTAGYEMDFTVEEIMQRFTRDDRSIHGRQRPRPFDRRKLHQVVRRQF